jgi:hypothetical protein
MFIYKCKNDEVLQLVATCILYLMAQIETFQHRKGLLYYWWSYDVWLNYSTISMCHEADIFLSLTSSMFNRVGFIPFLWSRLQYQCYLDWCLSTYEVTANKRQVGLHKTISVKFSTCYISGISTVNYVISDRLIGWPRDPSFKSMEIPFSMRSTIKLDTFLLIYQNRPAPSTRMNRYEEWLRGDKKGELKHCVLMFSHFDYRSHTKTRRITKIEHVFEWCSHRM